MTRRQIIIVLWSAISLVILLGIASQTVTSRSTGGSYTLAWTGITGGGSIKTGGTYLVIGTSGQPNTVVSTAGPYRLTTGFAAGVVARDHVIYLPIVLSG